MRAAGPPRLVTIQRRVALQPHPLVLVRFRESQFHRLLVLRDPSRVSLFHLLQELLAGPAQLLARAQADTAGGHLEAVAEHAPAAVRAQVAAVQVALQVAEAVQVAEVAQVAEAVQVVARDVVHQSGRVVAGATAKNFSR